MSGICFLTWRFYMKRTSKKVLLTNLNTPAIAIDLSHKDLGGNNLFPQGCKLIKMRT